MYMMMKLYVIISFLETNNMPNTKIGLDILQKIP